MITAVNSSTILNKSLLTQLELMDKAGVDLNMPDKPILSRNGSIITAAAAAAHNDTSFLNAASQYLDQSIHEIIITHNAKGTSSKTKTNSPTSSVVDQYRRYQLKRQEKN